MANSEENKATPSEQNIQGQGSSSHSGHSHSGEHHSRRRHRRPLRRRIQRWLDKKFGKHSTLVVNLFSAFVALLIIAAMVLVGIVAGGRHTVGGQETETEFESPSYTKNVDEIEMELPYFDEEVIIISEAANNYLSATEPVDINDIIDRYDSSRRLDIGEPVSLKFDFPSLPEDLAKRNVFVQISETADFAESRQWTTGLRRQNVEVYNLKTGTTYFYRIGFEGTSQFVQGSFTTADTRRFMNVAGAVNVRDIGGIRVSGGKVIGQGLLYRGSELDGAVEAEFQLKYEGLDTMLNVMGIKTEMDLRASSHSALGIDPLGKNVLHKYYSAPQYEEILTEPGKAAIRTIFADLAKKENYPIYLHCTYGLDRTGTICYLLEALLGADEADLVRDYELSALYLDYASGTPLEPMIAALKKTYEGNDITEKVENFLLSAGVTAEEIASIREIFLGA